jgi:protein transport protein SEC20
MKKTRELGTIAEAGSPVLPRQPFFSYRHARMSFDSLQERLTALQETTGQLQELIERLASLKFQPGSVPLSADEDDNVGSELGAEISQILREEAEDLEVLQEEVTDLRCGRPGSQTEHNKTRLQDGVRRLQQALKR